MKCTNVEQSKKLVELGLSRDTADMVYQYNFIKETNAEIPTVVVGSLHDTTLKNIPCWSLGALMELLPLEIYDKKFSDGGVGSFCTFRLLIWGHPRDYGRYRVGYQLITVRESAPYLNTCEAETMFDAVYGMVCWLLEKKSDFMKK